MHSQKKNFPYFLALLKQLHVLMELYSTISNLTYKIKYDTVVSLKFQIICKLKQLQTPPQILQTICELRDKNSIRDARTPQPFERVFNTMTQK